MKQTNNPSQAFEIRITLLNQWCEQGHGSVFPVLPVVEFIKKKTKQDKKHVIRVVVKDQVVYVHKLFRGAKSEKRVCFFIMVTNVFTVFFSFS